MKKIPFAFAAFALWAVTHQAVACEWGVHAGNSAATVVVCDNSGCSGVRHAQEATTTEPVAPRVADESANPAPITVADWRK